MYGGETYDLIKHFPYELPVSFSSVILYIRMTFRKNHHDVFRKN